MKDDYKVNDSSVNDSVGIINDETRSVYHFPIERNVKAIRFNLYTDEPYKIRYSMCRWKFLSSRKYGIFGPKGVRWGFIQIQNGKIPDAKKASEMIGDTDSSATYRVHTQGNIEDSDLYRWCIAISDVSAVEPNYYDVGQFVSKEITIPVPIGRIMLYTSEQLNGGDIEYYILTISGDTYRISPWEHIDEIKDDKYIPKIIYVNSDLQVERREQSKWGANAYIDTNGPMTSFRLMVFIKRGTDIQSTPKLYDYKLRIIPKDIG